jgi:hypothetical protein
MATYTRMDVMDPSRSGRCALNCWMLKSVDQSDQGIELSFITPWWRVMSMRRNTDGIVGSLRSLTPG